MPEICRFFGIIIRMFPREHNPPHIHAFFGDNIAIFSIESGQIINGDFPSKKSALVTAWILINQKELFNNWENLSLGIQANKIKPLS